MATVDNAPMTHQDGDENMKVSKETTELGFQPSDKAEEIIDILNNPSGKQERFDNWLNSGKSGDGQVTQQKKGEDHE